MSIKDYDGVLLTPKQKAQDLLILRKKKRR